MKQPGPIVDYASRSTEDPRRRRRRREAFRLLMMAVLVGGADVFVVVLTGVNDLESGTLVTAIAGLSGIFALASFERWLDSRRF